MIKVRETVKVNRLLPIIGTPLYRLTVHTVPIIGTLNQCIVPIIGTLIK